MPVDAALIYDVGLHKGEDTDFYLKKGYRVVAFEGNPDLVAECRARFSAEIASGRLTVVEGAIAPPEAGERIRFYKSDRSEWGTINSSWDKRNESIATGRDIIEVPRTDISEALRRFGIPYYSKIDIEGVDTLVLETLKSFSDRPRYISIESEKVDFNKLRREIETLQSLGYSRFRAVQQAYIPRRRLRTTDINGKALDYVFPRCSSGPFAEDVNQPWLSASEVIKEYERIFRSYRWFGDGAAIHRVPGATLALRVLGRLIGRPLPGWYDTHAAL